MPKQKTETDFDAECREAFAALCELYAESPFHIDKRRAMDKAYQVIEAWCDWRDMQTL